MVDCNLMKGFLSPALGEKFVGEEGEEGWKMLVLWMML
jgi:hypothetical protein